MRILRPKRTADFCEHLLVIEDPDMDEIKQFFPRMAFPVALLPDPVLPISTILISLSLKDSMPNLKKKIDMPVIQYILDLCLSKIVKLLNQ